jgi:hypothetical protein
MGGSHGWQDATALARDGSATLAQPPGFMDTSCTEESTSIHKTDDLTDEVKSSQVVSSYM